MVFQSQKVGGDKSAKITEKSRENERISKNCQKPHKNERTLGNLVFVEGGGDILEGDVHKTKKITCR